MVKCILDTDILSEYLKGHNPNVVLRALQYAKEHGVFTFTSVTVYEIIYGLELKSAAAQSKPALEWLKQNCSSPGSFALYSPRSRNRETWATCRNCRKVVSR